MEMAVVKMIPHSYNPLEHSSESPALYQRKLEERIASITRDNRLPEERIAAISRYVSGHRRALEEDMAMLGSRPKDLSTVKKEADTRAKLKILSITFEEELVKALKEFKDAASRAAEFCSNATDAGQTPQPAVKRR